MRTGRIRALALAVSLAATTVVSVALASPATAAVPGQVVITEWMYSPTNSAAGAEFVELTNIGGTPVDMTNYSYDDDSRLAGTVSLAGFGTLAPGEAALLVEKTAAAFRTDWSLAPSVKIVDLNTTNLGRDDEINIFNGTTLVDRLSYGDDIKFPGTIRTQGRSGAPATCLGLGANNVGAWSLAVVGDANASKLSTSGDVASPGNTNLGSCGPVTIVGGDGAGSGSGLACQPESPSGTGPAPAAAQAWPGGATVTVADQSCAWKTATGPEGRDMSGLVFDPANPSVLYAAKNKNSLFRMVNQGGLWVADTSNDWGAGKQILFPGGVGLPDSEGLTVGPDGALYVTTERDNAANAFALNSVLRFDPNAPGTTLNATQQWNLTADFPELIVPGGDKTKANLGFEGVTFVPDTYLVLNGFVDQSTGLAYTPADYPLHGTGLFFAALENDGKLYAYALNSDGSFHRVAVVDTGMGHTMDVQYDADLHRIWALCDNTCAVSSTVLKIDATGTMVPDVVYARPADAAAGLPNVNIEGFAIAPESTCVGGVKEVVWSDDGIAAPGHEGHALYSGTFPCGLDLGDQGAPAAVDLGDRGPDDVSVPQQGTLHVHGSGFVPGETVSVELHSTPVLGLASVAADGFGIIDTDVTIPRVAVGAHEIWLVAPSAAATAPLTVTPEVLPELTISDASALEGARGLQRMTFTVSLSKPATSPVTVLVSTRAGTAKAVLDFLPDLELVRFAPGQTVKTVTVWIVGDRKWEADESFSVRLDGNLGPARIFDGTGVGTIVNDD